MYLRSREPAPATPIHDQKDLAALRRDFHAKAWQGRVPIDVSLAGTGRPSIADLVSRMRGMACSSCVTFTSNR